MTQGLTIPGWIFLCIAWGLIISFSVFCFQRVLRADKKKKMVSSGQLPGEGRAEWASRIGLIMAVAGNAIGLGNFLRFPALAAAKGGGAFMIPYFMALIFLGVPLMWVEWTIGRYGGTYGHGTTPGMFQRMWNNKSAKYLGALGIALPFAVVIYYNFVESWTFGYAYFSATKKYFGHATSAAMNQFLRGYQGVESNQFFSSMVPLFIFLAITLFMNWYFLSRGISKGIEMLGKIGMPVLFVFGIILAIRVLTLGKPIGGEASIAQGMAYVWNPNFSMLSKAEVWLVAAGQIFFTLSLGQGVIQTYASYLKEKDDVTLNGLTTSATNEFAEVILGGTIAIPLAVAFFGLSQTQVIAGQGSFNLGFVALPVIFQKLPLGALFGTMWFGLLFIAGITSSVAMTSPAIAFFEDELKWKRTKAVNAVFAFQALCTLFVVFFFRYGALDELNYWAGTFGLVVFAAIEVIIFAWIFGMKKGWEEMHKGADLKVPRIFKFIIKYITPVYILTILGIWTYQEAIAKFFMKATADEPAIAAVDQPYRWATRVLFLVVILISLWMVRIAWKAKKEREEQPQVKA
jgi:SNF family Na+-dependent transporter